jgi:hypothetical protein
LTQRSALLEKQKTQKYKYLCTGNSYQLQISLLVICPLELIFNASFSQKIKKKFSGPKWVKTYEQCAEPSRVCSAQAPGRKNNAALDPALKRENDKAPAPTPNFLLIK